MLDNLAEKAFAEYGLIALCLMGTAYAGYKIFETYTKSVSENNQRIDKLITEYNDRLDKKEEEHCAFTQALSREAKEEREKLRCVIEDNTRASRDLIAVLEKRIVDLRRE